jgi:hypothetical protein
MVLLRSRAGDNQENATGGSARALRPAKAAARATAAAAPEVR